jgi:hypothetical protein
LEESREATPDSDSGYVIATVSTTATTSPAPARLPITLPATTKTKPSMGATSTTKPTAKLDHVLKKPPAQKDKLPEQPQPPKTEATKFSFLSELQNRGKPNNNNTTTNSSTTLISLNPVPVKKSSPSKDESNDDDEPTVNPFKVLKPAGSGSNAKRVVQTAPASSAPTLADQANCFQCSEVIKKGKFRFSILN